MPVVTREKNEADRRFVVVQVVMVLIGVPMIALALAADWLGMGRSSGFGLDQVVGAMVGVGLLVGAFSLGVNAVRHWAKRFLFSRVALISISLLVGLMIGELSLRILVWFERPKVISEIIGFPRRIPDPNLGVRLAAHSGGLDGKGFRNDAVPAQVDIVAIGDSQTWGTNVHRSQAWPQTLEKLSGLSVYNMAVAGYGPVQYSVLAEEALKLSPKLIVIGLYFGNDLYDAYSLVYGREAYAQFRINGATHDLSDDTISPRYWALRANRMSFRGTIPGGWTAWIAGHTAIGRLLYKTGWLQNVSRLAKNEADRAWARASPERGAVYENGDVHTVFTTTRRMLALDLNEPRIAEGLRITKEMQLRIKAKTDERDVKLLIFLIPTKEMVYADAMRMLRTRLDDTYARLVQMELKARTEILSWCKQKSIVCVDALPTLKKAVQRSEQIYPPSTDGHPNARGYFFLASAVHQALIRRP